MKIIMTFAVFLVMHLNIFAQTLPYNQEFQVNTYTYEDQSHTQIAVLNSGTQVFCWDSWEHLGSYRGVYAQMYDENGLKKGDEIHVNSYIDSYQINPKISALSNSGFIICWESNGQDGSSYGVFAQLFDENGVKIGEEFQVNTYINNRQGDAVIKVINTGDIIICWESDGQDGSGYGVFAQIFDSSGVKKGLEFQVNTYTSGYQFHPNILGFQTGGFIIVWDCFGQNGVYARLFNPQGIPLGQEFRINSSLNNSTREPQAYLLNSNNILIFWGGVSIIPKIFAKIIDINGNTIKEEWQVNTSEEWWSRNPIAVILKSGYFTICWEYFNVHFSGADLRSQMFDHNGNKFGEEVIVKSRLYGIQYAASILSLPDSGYIISIHEVINNYDIYAHIFDKNRIKKYEEFRVNSNTIGHQTNPQLVNIAEKGFLVQWSGPDGSNVGIFAKYFLNEPIEHQLTDFNLLLPQNNETVYITNPQFVWEKASDIRICFPWEIKYDLFLSTNENFINPIVTSEIEDTTLNLVTLTAGNTYYWKVIARNIAGDSLWCSSVYHFYVDPNAVEVEELRDQLSNEFNLSQNYPNPFNPTTKIKYSISSVTLRQAQSDVFVVLKIYDVLGNEIATLVNEEKTAGNYEVEFDGSSLTSGVYLYELQTGNYSSVKKMILMR